MSFKEDKNTLLQWSRYTPPSQTNGIQEENIPESLKKAYEEKNITQLLKHTKTLVFFGFSYYTWFIWRWFTPKFYQKLLVVFIQSQTDDEETQIKGWFSYTARNLPKKIQHSRKEFYNQIIDDWTVETSFRIALLPLALILGCFQSSYARYSFLFPNHKNPSQSLSWKDFQRKGAKLEAKQFQFYDKFIIIKGHDTTSRIVLPPTTSNKEIIGSLRKTLKASLTQKKKNRKLSSMSTKQSLQKTLNPNEKKKKIFSKNKVQYRKNYFRHLRKSSSSLKVQTPDLFFHNDPKNFFPGFFSNFMCFFRIYAALFPLWIVLKVLEQINLLKADARTTKARKVRKLQNKKRFKDLAGIDKLLPDLKELVQTLNVQLSQTKLSIYAPKGYILVGPPGTGKTLLAQAIAGESGVTFFFTAGSEFVENQNGIGPARLRDLFNKAKKESPAIIFIDEIDTLGKTREGSVNSLGGLPQSPQGEEKIQILTEFLVQMDGFSERNNLIIIGATNFLDLLDPAFIRPGRFDRIFQLELPSKAVRVEILKLHASKKGTDPTIPWDYFAKCTNGFSGADLSAIVNESFLKVLREKRSVHTFETLQHGFDRISSYSTEQGNQKKEDPFQKIRIAYYQAGIAVIHALLPELENQLVVNLHPRPKNLRYLKLDKQIKSTIYSAGSTITNKKQLEAKLLGYLAGIATEFSIFSLLSPTSHFWLSQQGASDLEKATDLVQTMIDDYGMYDDAVFLANCGKWNPNSTSKRFNPLEMDSYNQIWESSNNTFFQVMNEEEDKEKPIRMNWRFLSFWVWELTSQLHASKPLPKWGKSYIDERTEENQDSFVSDEYFHKNQLFSPSYTYKEKKDILIQTKIKQAWEKLIRMNQENREMIDALAFSILQKERLTEQEILEIISKKKVRM